MDFHSATGLSGALRSLDQVCLNSGLLTVHLRQWSLWCAYNAAFVVAQALVLSSRRANPQNKNSIVWDFSSGVPLLYPFKAAFVGTAGFVFIESLGKPAEQELYGLGFDDTTGVPLLWLDFWNRIRPRLQRRDLTSQANGRKECTESEKPNSNSNEAIDSEKYEESNSNVENEQTNLHTNGGMNFDHQEKFQLDNRKKNESRSVNTLLDGTEAKWDC